MEPALSRVRMGPDLSRATAEPIRTERLELLPLAVGHAEEMAEVLADPALHTYIGGEPADVAALRARYERMTAGSPDPAVRWLNWVIRAEGRLVGTVQATVEGTDRAELAWVVGTPWQGRGFAREAARALAGRLTDQGVTVLTAHIHPDHHASAAVAAGLGLRPTGERQDGEIRWRREDARSPRR
ncbi:GNAT family N-acetyltransferase [Kitasatospora sp. NPDC002227]|uniref:GNAT family N-acetyltransferase n=1 Tax=Kitasatospora sp. NPDC002227 TaxID=3154773 RepID=UPI0033307DFD